MNHTYIKLWSYDRLENTVFWLITQKYFKRWNKYWTI